MNCHHCNVPNDLHGTCCGWNNAKHPCSREGVIIDARHPGFGQHLTRWIHSYLDGSEDSYEITEKSSFTSGWDAAMKVSVITITKKEEPNQEEDLIAELDDVVGGTYFNVQIFGDCVIVTEKRGSNPSKVTEYITRREGKD